MIHVSLVGHSLGMSQLILRLSAPLPPPAAPWSVCSFRHPLRHQRRSAALPLGCVCLRLSLSFFPRQLGVGGRREPDKINDFHVRVRKRERGEEGGRGIADCCMNVGAVGAAALHQG